MAAVARPSDWRPRGAREQDWAPNPGPQTRYLACSAYEALYGGQAGGGKSESLLIAALRYVHRPEYHAVLFRRSFPELERTLIKRAFEIYPHAGGKYNASNHVWRFNGAEIRFGHLENDRAVYEHQGVEYQFIGFDELTHFSEEQYRYLLSRGRSSKGIPIRIRSGSNPGGAGHDWVFKRWGAWLDPDHERRAKPGDVRWYVRSGDSDDTEREGEPHEPDALSRSFFPATLEDNPKGDASYSTKLKQLDPVSRAQLLHGDWMARPAAGLYFKKAWFEILDHYDGPAQWCRYWDRAASLNGDWTVGAKWGRCPDGRFVVADVVRFRGRPADVESKIKATTIADRRSVTQVLEEDPGQAGIADVDNYVRLLAGYDVRRLRPTGDKVTRARAASAQSERGMVRLIRSSRSAQRMDEPNAGDWNSEWIAEHEAFPTVGVHDDQVDTSSGAVAFLTGNLPPTMDGSEAFLKSMPRPRM